MSRFFVPPSSIRGTHFTMSGGEAHHALQVLRKKIGDEIDLFDGKDRSFRGRIDIIDHGEIQGTLLANLVSSPQLPIRITLYQALTRGPKWEWLLEKATEIGVSAIVPVVSVRTLIRLTVSEIPRKVERWNRLTLAAAKQCGRSEIPPVQTPQPLINAFHQMHPEQLSLIPWEKEQGRSVHSACQGFGGKQVNIFIGPEGGWEAGEIDQARQYGIIPVRLGPTLLRTETAGFVAATLVLHEFGIY